MHNRRKQMAKPNKLKKKQFRFKENTPCPYCHIPNEETRKAIMDKNVTYFKSKTAEGMILDLLNSE